MAKVDYKVSVLVDKISRQELQLPEMQRKYVWTATKVRDLLDSLYRGYPSGVILAWEPAGHVETTDFAVATEAGGMKPLLLLDGQQRLTSLSAVLRGEPVKVKGRTRPVEILFNLDHPDELTFITEVGVGSESEDDADEPDEAEDDLLTRVSRRAFVVASNQVLALPNWVKVTDVFKREEGEILQQIGLTGFDDPRYGKYTTRLKALRAIKDYEYRVDVLESTKSYEEVTEIFVRVNSLGAKLRSSDLALAQITAKWNGSLALFTAYQGQLSSRGFDLDLGIHLKTLVSLITGQSRFLTVGSLTRAQLEDGWKRTQRAMNFAIDFAKSNLHIDSPTLLSSPFLLIALAYWADQRGYRSELADAQGFSQWFLTANAKGRYSRGSSETLLDQDLAALRGTGGAAELTQRLIQQVGRLDFTPADLAGRTARSGAFKTMFLAFRANGAQDWTTGLKISPKHADKADKIEFHHIFPKGYMRKARPDLDPRLVDDIANLAFIGAKTNKEISAHAPKEYAAWFSGEQLKAQLVEFPDGMDDPEGFERFIENRRGALAQEINEFLGFNEIERQPYGLADDFGK
ncbi:GmrSD restriction endonuclease domain-containing protein [Pseudarthrobacter oxydans]|uniref:GmrSD restriction endonuclease domain-containing protein n=1 Tax=Pseudarthrobacter oxydans TaxID=1671 RepID=UPI0038275E16